MEIRLLKYFLAVANTGNISKAAETLHITQPTLSRQLKQFEEELNTQLFARGKKSITLTQEGMLLKRRAQEIIELTDIAENELNGNSEVVCGDIFIGSAEVHAFHKIANNMKEFSNMYPKVKYNLFSGNADDIKERIDKGLIDIGILSEPVDIEKYDFIRMPDKETWGIILPKNCDLAKNKYIEPKDLKNIPIINTKRIIVQSELANWFGDIYDELNVIATYNLIYNAAIMVEEGLGYAISIDNLVNTNYSTNLCFREFYPKLETGIVIVWKKHQFFSSAVTRFIEKMKNIF